MAGLGEEFAPLSGVLQKKYFALSSANTFFFSLFPGWLLALGFCFENSNLGVANASESSEVLLKLEGKKNSLERALRGSVIINIYLSPDIIFVKKFTQPQFLAPKIYAKKA